MNQPAPASNMWQNLSKWPGYILSLDFNLDVDDLLQTNDEYWDIVRNDIYPQGKIHQEITLKFF